MAKKVGKPGAHRGVAKVQSTHTSHAVKVHRTGAHVAHKAAHHGAPAHHARLPKHR